LVHTTKLSTSQWGQIVLTQDKNEEENSMKSLDVWIEDTTNKTSKTPHSIYFALRYLLRLA
jgi:regulator of PEP synthase PpsR (kinase-PPPase family)